MTVAYRIVHGRAKHYRYWGAKYYRIRKRKKDNVYTFRPIREYGPDRRSYRLAVEDAKFWARKLKIGFDHNIRLGTKYLYIS